MSEMTGKCVGNDWGGFVTLGTRTRNIKKHLIFEFHWKLSNEYNKKKTVTFNLY